MCSVVSAAAAMPTDIHTGKEHVRKKGGMKARTQKIEKNNQTLGDKHQTNDN